jgi:hypothetical protein
MIDDKKKKNCLVFKGKEKWLKRQKTKNTWCMVGKIYHSKPLIWGTMSLLINPPTKLV